MIGDWETYVKKATEAASEATTEEALERYQEEHRRVSHAIGKRALALAKDHPGDPAAIDALLWVVGKGYRPETGEAFELLARDYITDERIAPACPATRREVASEPARIDRFLRAALSRSPHRDVRGQACMGLAEFLSFRAEAIRYARSHPEEPPWYEAALLTPEDLAMYRDRTPDDLDDEAVLLYERVVAEFADLKDRSGRRLDEVAEGKLERIRNLVVGKVAPEIKGEDVDGTRLKLSDYRGKVVVLTFSGNWCPPCRAMYPKERALVERLKGEPFALLSVNTDEDRETLRKSITSGEITWRCWWDGEPGGPICTRWGITVYPTIHVLDHRGIIRFRDVPEKELDAVVDSLLAEAKP